jgi:hypothetical protein
MWAVPEGFRGVIVSGEFINLPTLSSMQSNIKMQSQTMNQNDTVSQPPYLLTSQAEGVIKFQRQFLSRHFSLRLVISANKNSESNNCDAGGLYITNVNLDFYVGIGHGNRACIWFEGQEIRFAYDEGKMDTEALEIKNRSINETSFEKNFIVHNNNYFK